MDPNRRKAGVLAAVTGCSAVAVMGVLFAAGHGGSAQNDYLAKTPVMNVGSTTTETTPSAVEATTLAAPAMKGPAALPKEEQGPAAP
jgi:hypothetical protein